MEEKSTKILVPTIVAVVTLIALVVGATYAYFTVGATNNFETRTIEASAGSVGVVTLTSNEDNLYLNVPAHLMMKDAIPEGQEIVRYYAVSDPDGLPSTSDPNYTVATFTLTGEGTYECSYDWDLTLSGTMFDVAKTIAHNGYFNVIAGIQDDEGNSFEHFMEYGEKTNSVPIVTSECVAGSCSDSFNFNIGGTHGNNHSVRLFAELINDIDVDQSALAGTSMTVDFDITDFSCTAVEE